MIFLQSCAFISAPSSVLFSYKFLAFKYLSVLPIVAIFFCYYFQYYIIESTYLSFTLILHFESIVYNCYFELCPIGRTYQQLLHMEHNPIVLHCHVPTSEQFSAPSCTVLFLIAPHRVRLHNSLL